MSNSSVLLELLPLLQLPRGTAPADPAACLGPTDVIESEQPAIRDLAQRLTAGLDSPPDKARALFDYVRDEIVYNFAPLLATRSDWRASATLARGDGFCQQKALLLAALARAVGIPSQIGFQHLKDYKLLETRYVSVLPDGVIPFHGLNALYLNGRWIWADATLDAGLSERRGYRLVEFRADEDMLLPATDLAGRPHFDFLAEFGPYPDLPVALSDAFASLHTLWREWHAFVTRTGVTM